MQEGRSFADELDVGDIRCQGYTPLATCTTNPAPLLVAPTPWSSTVVAVLLILKLSRVHRVDAQVGSHFSSGFLWIARVSTLLLGGPAAVPSQRRQHTAQTSCRHLRTALLAGSGWDRVLDSWFL